MAQDRPTDYQVKAVFLEKFGKFVEWPGANSELGMTNVESTNLNTNETGVSANRNPEPITIGVFPGAPEGFLDALRTVSRGDSIDGRPVRVVEIKALPDLQSCQIVYLPVGTASAAAPAEVLAYINDQHLPILTVGDGEAFYAAGGMIAFEMEQAQVHFRIHADVARAVGLKISSKLLSLAKP